MMKKISTFIVSAFLAVTTTTTVLTPTTALAASTPACDGGITLGFITWYRYLTYSNNGNCELKQISDEKGNTGSTVTLNTFIWTVALNIVQILMTAVAFITVFFIIKGGFNYMTSRGDAGNMAKAKQNVQNAVIGLIIAMMAAIIVNTVAGAL